MKNRRTRISASILPFMLLLLSVAPCLWAQGLPSAPPEDVGLSGERLQRLNGVLQGYVDRDEVAGVVALIARRGRVAYLESFGMADRESGRPMRPDAIFRIASMTKPITTVAVMMLFEEGELLLSEPIARYVPEFKDPNVLVPVQTEGVSDPPFVRAPAKRDITIRDLLAHTSGLTYGFFGHEHISDLYRKAGISDGLTQTEGTLGQMVKKLAELPLRSHPGESWEYGLSTDVLGYLVEVVSGVTLDAFLRDRIFTPLGMRDTHFFLPEGKLDRLTAVYGPDKEGRIVRYPEEEQVLGPVVFSTSWHYKGPRTYYSGGGGLVSTISGYVRFLQMLLNGGELDGVRLLSPKTIELMTVNHIGDLDFWSRGYRFGLGFAIHEGPASSGEMGSVGEYTWGGFFNTTFWVDPEEAMVGVMMTQLYPNDHLDIRQKFRVLAYQAIVH
ncbi:MAG: serine hydrolase domain-containing protein [Acidobacteriota bacterium]